MKEEKDTMNANFRACKRELHRKEAETEKLKKKSRGIRRFVTPGLKSLSG